MAGKHYQTNVDGVGEKVTQSSNLSNDNIVNNYIVSIPFVTTTKTL